MDIMQCECGNFAYKRVGVCLACLVAENPAGQRGCLLQVLQAIVFSQGNDDRELHQAAHRFGMALDGVIAGYENEEIMRAIEALIAVSRRAQQVARATEGDE